MDINQVLTPVRPITQLIGAALLIAGCLKYFGLGIPITGSAIEIAAIGFFVRSI